MNASVTSACGVAAVNCSMIGGKGATAAVAAFGPIVTPRLRGATEEEPDKARDADQNDNPDHHIVHVVSSPARAKRNRARK